MGKCFRRLAFPIALCLMISAGCSDGGPSVLKPSAAGGGAGAGGSPDPNPGHGPGPGGQQPIPFPAFASHLVHEARYLPAAEARLDARDRADLDTEARECGFTDAAVSACLSSKFTAAQIWISAPGPSQLWIQGTAARSRDTGRTYFQIRISTMSRAMRTEPVRVRVFSAQADPRSDLGALVAAARARVHAVPAEQRLERLEQALESVLVAEFAEWTFADAASFAAAYALQAGPRAFYHWSAVALANGLGYPAVKSTFASRFADKIAASDPAYKEAFLEQGLLAEERWAIGRPIVSAFRTELASARDRTLKGKSAVALLVVAPAGEAARDQLLSARDFVLETADLEWVRRGIGLFRKYGETLGQSSDLARFAIHPARQIRIESAAAFASYSDETAEQWILRLNADAYSDVRQAALAVIAGRNHDYGDFDVASLIDPSSWAIREGLARGLRHARGHGVDRAILKLNADAVSSVREAAYAAIGGRELATGGFAVASLIDRGTWYSRQGLARALKHAPERTAQEALVRLNADPVGSVRESALESIRGRNHDFGAWNVSQLIDGGSWYSREGLARGLRHALGSGADEALLRLSADPVGSVRDAAYESAAARPFDAGGFEVTGLIDSRNWSSRQGLARALRYVTGQKSIAALVALANDSVGSVKDAARESLRAHGIRDVT